MSFQSVASDRFWQLYRELPEEIQKLADKQYELFEHNPFHPSLQLKQVVSDWNSNDLCSVSTAQEGRETW